MSEIKTSEVEIIPLDSVIEIKVGGEFVARLSAFISNFFPYKSKEHFAELIKHIKEDTNQDDPYVYHFKTLIALQAHIEQEAKFQGKTKMVTINTETGEPVTVEENQPAPQVQEQPE